MSRELPRVLHVSTPSGWRGGEQQLMYLVRGLAALDVGQTVACPPGSAVERACREGGFAHVALGQRAAVDPLFAWALGAAARDARSDVVHVHDSHGHTAAVIAAALFGLRAPIVLHRRVLFRAGRGPLTRWKYRHPSVRRIVCVSRAVADALRLVLPDDDRRVRIVPEGIDVARFPAAPDGRLRRALGVAPGVPLVGYVAAFTYEKDHRTFLDAAAAAVASGLAAQFVLVGDGPLRAEIAARARALGIAERVHFTGFRDDVPAILPELDVFLFTSKEEGLGSSILDAYACGVPVVATAAGGVPEIVSDGETGLLAPIRDSAALASAVGRVLADRALRARLVEGGARRVADFGVERMAERTLAIYREVAAES